VRGRASAPPLDKPIRLSRFGSNPAAGPAPFVATRMLETGRDGDKRVGSFEGRPQPRFSLQRPPVKSGKAWGALPWATDVSLRAEGALHAAAS
jgi:hypothetical protein